MSDFHTFAGGGEHHRMIADDLAGTDRRNADRSWFAFPAARTVDRDVLQLAPARLGQYLAHAERRARWRVEFMAVMRLDDFDVRLLAEHTRREVQQAQAQVHADAHVGGEYDADFARRLVDALAAGVVEAGGADHHAPPFARAPFQVRQRRRRTGEIDEHVELGVERRADGDADRWDAGELAGVAADGGRIGALERAGDLKIGRRGGGLDQRTAHTAGGAGDGNAGHGRSLI